jgi:alpha-L-fucosidase
MKTSLAAITILTLCAVHALCADEQDVPRASPKDTQWWENARFGMFIHWGPYSLKGVEASWPLYGGSVPRAEYEALPQRFNPTKLDAPAIARLARRAGMKYLVFTSKHHDGFAMYDTALSDYSIMHTPYDKDICRMIVDACRAKGLRVGFYFSMPDWHHPDYMTAPSNRKPGPGLLPQELDPARWERYVRFLHGQVRELCTNYGKLDIMWFDLGGSHTAEQWKSAELHEMVRGLQPHIIINNRGGGDFGDYATPEQRVPAGGQAGLWETCMTINRTWAYNPSDTRYKSVDELLTVLANTASGGGNLLLNVGPMPTGEIQPEFVERLEAIGDWLRVNGISIYGTRAAPGKLCPEQRITMTDRRLFVHILAPPKDGKLRLSGLVNPIVDAHLLSTRQPLPVTRLGEDVAIDLSGVGVPLKHEVVVIRFRNSLDASIAIRPGPDGIIPLLARDATCHGEQVRYQDKYDDIGAWMSTSDWVEWKARIEREADYEVIISQGAPRGQGGTYTLRAGTNALACMVTETGSWTQYENVTLGSLRLAPGVYDVSIRPMAIKAVALMNVKYVEIRPND